MPNEWRALSTFTLSATTTATGGNVYWTGGPLWSASTSTSTATITYDIRNGSIYPMDNNGSMLDQLWSQPLRTYGNAGRPPSEPRRPPVQAPAVTRARELLTGFLNELQQAQYDREGKFDIVGSDGTLYRIGPGTNGNVEWIDPATGQVKGRLCAHPRTFDYENRRIPEPDLHLGQLLALTTDERAWLEVANLHRGEWPPTHQARRIELPADRLAA